MAANFPSSPSPNQVYTYGTRSWYWTGTAWKLYTAFPDIINLDNLQYQFDGVESRFKPTVQGKTQTISNPFTLLLSVNGIIQSVSLPEYVWGTPFTMDGFMVDSDGYITERVIWPDYDTGKLKYPKDLEKGAICLFFLQRRVGKDQTKIYDVKVLDENK